MINDIANDNKNSVPNETLGLMRNISPKDVVKQRWNIKSMSKRRIYIYIGYFILITLAGMPWITWHH